MKKILLFSILTFYIFLFTACQPKTAEWKGTIEDVDGVTVVKNPAEPLYGEDVFLLEEEISIGTAAGKEEYTFSRISGIDVNKEGNIYLIDALSVHIRVFDKDGQYLRTIGRKGQGPGELQMPTFVQITSHNELLVYDYMTQMMIFYSLEGEFLRQNSTAETGSSFLPVRLDSLGNFTVVISLAPLPVGGKILKRYNSSLELISELAREEKGERGIFDIGKPTWFCDVSVNDNLIWGNSKEYKLQVLNNQGELTKIIQKKYRPIEITAEDKRKYNLRYEEPLGYGMKITFRSHFPAYSEISVDNEERIYVKTYERVNVGGEFYFFDVFDPEGIYISKVPIRANLIRNSVWKNSRLYTIEEDEDGYPVVKRYKVSWNY